MSHKPLSDVFVIDASQGIAGPAAGAMLADFGAKVISLEPPKGKTARGYAGGAALANISRNKQSIAVDLKTEEGQAVLEELVADADVFLHNNRPGVSESLGCGYDKLSEINPELVYCSITGYGETGPYKDRPTVDPLAQAMSGIMEMTGEPDRKPSRVGVSVSDMGTAVYAAFGVLTGLRTAEQTGEGQKIETSLFDTAAAFMGVWYSHYSKFGEVPHRQGHSWEPYAPAGIFETSTGQIYLATPFQYLWERVCEAVEREDWLSDPRFKSEDARRENREELIAVMDEEFSKYNREELLDRLLEAGVPASEVHTVPEATEDEHLHQRGTIQQTEDHEGDDVLALSTPVMMSGEPPQINQRPPRLGEHSKEILQEVGFDPEVIDNLIDEDVVIVE
ncbi:CaiB/BaiF CoA transferase family protein [Halobellus rubicundus]|uniref:CaiB/BaiF CoA transferase family protein n=1 Tax=Halobellus rubicundus TaxID=2996466 RepID=A0ABD5MIP5_9EURY